MKLLLLLIIICLLFFSCDIPGRLTIKNRVDKTIAITLNDEYSGRMPFSDTSYYLVIAPKENAYLNYGWAWRWTRKDEARFYHFIQNNTEVLEDSLNVHKPKIRLRRQGLIGKGLVMRVR